MSYADNVANAFAKVPELATRVGTFSGVTDDGAQALVNLDDRQIVVSACGSTWPIVGDRVRLLRIDQTWLMLGSVQQRSTLGRVTVVGSPKCTIEYPPNSGVTDLMSMPKGATP